MEISRLVRDNLESANSHESSTTLGSKREEAPLLPKKLSTGRVHVLVVDVEQVEEIDTLEKAKQDAEEDAKLSAVDVVCEESVRLARLAAPMVAAGLVELVFDTIQAIMVGFVHPDESAKVLAAFYLAAFLQTLLLRSLLEGLSCSLDALCRRAVERKRVEDLWLYCQAGLLAFGVCAPLSALALVNGSAVLQWLGQDPAIAAIAGEFLGIYACAIPFGVLFSVMKSALHAQNVSTPIVASVVIGALTGDIPAYFLAYHTPLGYYGLAFTGPIEWAVKTLVLLPCFARNELLRETWPGWKPREALALVPEIARLGVSSTLTVAFQIIGFSFTAVLAGLLPNPRVAITASSIFAALLTLAAIPLVGINTGGAIRISNALKEGKARRAALTGRLVLAAAVGVSALAALASVYIARPLASAFTPDHRAVQLADELAHALVPIILLLGVSFGLEAILRGSGGSLIAAKSSVVCIFVLGAPLGLVFATELDGDVAGLWLGNAAGTAAFVAIGVLWLCGLRWEALAHAHTHSPRAGRARAAEAFS